MKKYTFDCYHGTRECSWNEIALSRRFKIKKRNNHWLGNGVYFFIDDKNKAFWWAEQLKCENNSEPVVLNIDIQFKENELLNLDTEEGLNTLESFAKELRKSMKEYNVMFRQHEWQCTLMDAFKATRPNLKGVKRMFISTADGKILYESDFSINSYQLCVFEQKIIDFDKIKVLSKVC